MFSESYEEGKIPLMGMISLTNRSMRVHEYNIKLEYKTHTILGDSD